MAVFRIEIGTRQQATGEAAEAARRLRDAGLGDVTDVAVSRLFFLEGSVDRPTAEAVAQRLLTDPVIEQAAVLGTADSVPEPPAGHTAFEVHPRPGVMDPVAESTLAELRQSGRPVTAVRTARRYVVAGGFDVQQLPRLVGRALANDCVEQVVLGTAGVRPAPQPPAADNQLRTVALRDLDDPGLERLSRTGHLFLSLAEMQAVQAHFQALGRDPTDVELETIAQTWSEHCVHKTLKSAIHYRGTDFPADDGQIRAGETDHDYDNLLAETVARATHELIAAQRGPHCLSVFEDNAGIIAFDDEYGIAFKAETHNHPSAIEPYGGAATGIGGVIRDTIGCGLGARPIANTDVFCVAPVDWSREHLPKGVLHPDRVLRGIVQGVADYGNRMGIPTVNGTVCQDPRYLGNPLVFCGSVGLIPRNCIHKQAQPGDWVVVVGGRTGRDGIHGATFSSAELTDTHAVEFSHAVQIGNAITEKRFLDAILQARDAEGGCLYSAITDCGAGGLSSAVGEMGETVGAEVDLERVPLKYAGLRYDEVWISEAQERMVLAVPPAKLDALLKIMQLEEVEATVIGTFGSQLADGSPRVLLRYAGEVVGELSMPFLHHGVPKMRRQAEWTPASVASGEPAPAVSGTLRDLLGALRRVDTTSQEWIIRKYDHEVQGGSVIKPLVGPGHGPADAAVLRPRLRSPGGIAIGCGITPHLADADPYWMAAAAIDEAVRNVVCVGGDFTRTAILDNFCWGRSDDPRQLGGLVRACQACYDVAVAYGVPFVSGKDSLNNEFAMDEADVAVVLAALRERAGRDDADAAHLRRILGPIEERLARTHRLSIPPTLLISALSLVADVTRCVTPDLKRPGAPVLLVGGLPATGYAPATAARIHQCVADLIRDGLVASCHDVSEGGWLVALAEMAFAGRRGVDVQHEHAPLDGGLVAAYVLEPTDADAIVSRLQAAQVVSQSLGVVRTDGVFAWRGDEIAVSALRAAWAGQA